MKSFRGDFSNEKGMNLAILLAVTSMLCVFCVSAFILE